MPGELTIVGIGLIGASFALATRRRFSRINALDPDDVHVELALSRGIVDSRVSTVPESSEAVLLACPSDRIAGWVADLEGHPGTVFDTGSVKAAVLRDVMDRLGRIPANFVPTHPIAGLEQSGPGAADAALFRDRMVIVTPVPETDVRRQQAVEGWWRETGAALISMDPEDHDRVYARTSHLPHLLAFAYLLGIDEGDLEHTGGGFRDFSRIGGSDPEMWAGIFDRNREALLAALDTFEADLAAIRAALAAGDTARCRALIAEARKRREAL